MAKTTKADTSLLLAAMEKLTDKRKGKALPDTPKELPAPVPQMRLDLWPDSVRGVPNAILRGSLFTVNQIRTTATKRELLATLEGIELRFKGERFNQSDLDVWEMLLHLGRQQPLGHRVEFSAHALLKALGRGTSGKAHEELKEAIARLIGGVIEVTWGNERKTFSGALVTNYFRDDETQRYVVTFSEKMSTLFEGGYSHVNWEQRQQLGKNSLAKWLHGILATHAAPYPYKVATIRKLSGSTTTRLSDFRKALRHALDELKRVHAITHWDITDDDLVVVTRIPTLSQQRSLAKKRQK